MQRHLGRLFDRVERELHHTHLMILSYRDIIGEDTSAMIHMHRIVGDIERGLYTLQIGIERIIGLDGDAQFLLIGIDELGEAGQQDQRIAELTPVIARGVAFLTPMHIQRTHQRRALTTIVVQSQQLESCIILCTQVALYLVLIAEGLQLSTGHQEFLCHLLHTIIAQQITENLEVARLIGTRILRNLLEIREGAPLSLLVGNDGRVVGCSALIVARILYATEVVVIARRGFPVPVQSTGTTLYMIFRTTVPGPSATYRSATIHLRRVILMHLFYPVITISHPVTGWFIASSHHHKRGVMTIFIDNTF